MSGPAYLDLPRCPRAACGAAAGFIASGLRVRCAVCGDWWLASEEEDALYSAARKAWLEQTPPGHDKQGHEDFIRDRAGREAEKVRRLREGNW